ncbi:MAG: PKD domain-containing protein, partial [Flavobacteriales bacterium]
MKIKLFILFLGLCFGNRLISQSDMVFIENKGQWDNRIVFNKILSDGNLFLEKDGFTYSLYDKSYIHSLHHDKATPAPDSIKSHVVKTKFLNSNLNVKLIPQNQSAFYFNYFTGSDSTKWQSNVKSTSKIKYQELYSNIDLLIYQENNSTKYDFVIAPSGNPNDIEIEYQGADSIYVLENRLIIENTINDFEEAEPYAYQIIKGSKTKVDCQYVLSGNILSFYFPNGYDQTVELIIDPVVVFSSYTGSTADNFGFTASYDDDENTYVGGIVFGAGVYPTTLGAYQTSFNTSPWYYVDIAISKFNINGSSLLYSTYLGGNLGSEAPHSLVVNDNDELLVLGTTGSSDYPTTSGCFDTSFSGGTNAGPLFTGVYYFFGCDIVVTKLNSAGTNLLGSTYVGGDGNDGVNNDASLAYNYGDPFRGEIIVDSSGNPIITSTTGSINFPTTIGACQDTFGGGTSDACVFKLNNNLSNLQWSSYFGGTGADAGYGIQLDSRGDVFITGGTLSSNLSMDSNSYDSSYNGLEDGFIAKFDFGTNSLLASTYVGTYGYDQSYFVQLDINDDVYITGQSLGSYPVSSSVYSDSGSTQFFQKFTNELDSSYWSTVVGSGRNSIDFTPSAFLVNDCGFIYLSGWGGVVNRYYRAKQSSTVGLPITFDAFQSTTDGSDFYLMVLDRDASALKYGTFYGGGVSYEHVDGGTSRFDKKGNVYQAVCAGCGGNSDLPTTPGAWSDSNNSPNCNLGVIKLNVSYIKTIASAPVPNICLPDSVSFVNNSSGGNVYQWTFGDGNSSSLFEPTHVYADTGVYLVTLIVSDSTGCVPSDTATIIINAYKPKALLIDTVPIICPGDSVQLIARNSQGISWSPSISLTNDSIYNPIAFPDSTTTYRAISNFFCNSDTAYVTVEIDTTQISIIPDSTICPGTQLNLFATGGGTYSWSSSSSITSPTSPNPTISPLISDIYKVVVTSVNGCAYTDSVSIGVRLDSMTISPDTSICLGDSVFLNSSGGGSYTWSPSSSLSSSIVNNPMAFPSITTLYKLDVISSNGCFFYDSVKVVVFNDPYSVSPDTAICPGESAQLSAYGGTNYSWNYQSTLSSTSLYNPIATPNYSTQYQVIITSPNGCLLYDTVNVQVNIDTINTIPDTTICEGNSINLWASGGVSYSWYPIAGIINPLSPTPTVIPSSPRYYFVDVTSAFGCVYTDSVFVDFYLDSMTISPDTSICPSHSAPLNSSGGGTYFWNHGTSLSSVNIPNPVASPTSNTNYQLTVITPNGCVLTDTVEVKVFVESYSVSPDTTICLGDSARLLATGGATYQWNYDPSLSSTTIPNPFANPTLKTNYWVDIISPNGCIYQDTIEVSLHIDNYGASNDTAICFGDSVQLFSYGGVIYNWSPSAFTSSSSTSSPYVTPISGTGFQVSMITPNGCSVRDSVFVSVDTNFINQQISNDTILCDYHSVFLSASGGTSYSWSPSYLFTNPNRASTMATVSNTTMLYVDVSNACFTVRDSVRVTLIEGNAVSIPNETICRDNSTQ